MSAPTLSLNFGDGAGSVKSSKFSGGALGMNVRALGVWSDDSRPLRLIGQSACLCPGLFINGEFVAGEGGKTIDVVNPTTGEKIGEVSEASPKDVDRAVEAAQKAFDTVWGTKCPPHDRARYMHKLADAIEANIDEIAAIEVRRRQLAHLDGSQG